MLWIERCRGCDDPTAPPRASRAARRGRGFEYRDPAGDRIDDPEALERISQLAIPPAWREVWICMDSLGHLQATGARRRRAQAVPLPPALALPSRPSEVRLDDRLRRVAAAPAAPPRRDLASTSEEATCRAVPTSGEVAISESLSRERVLACSVRLLDLGFFRIGSEDYAERNESYGLTTMLKRHVSIADGEVIFDYIAKSGVRRVQAIADAGRARGGRGAQATARRGSAARLPRRPPLGRDPRRGRQRLHQAHQRWRLHRQGLPHLERHGARRGRAGRNAGAGLKGGTRAASA